MKPPPLLHNRQRFVRIDRYLNIDLMLAEWDWLFFFLSRFLGGYASRMSNAERLTHNLQPVAFGCRPVKSASSQKRGRYV